MPTLAAKTRKPALRVVKPAARRRPAAPAVVLPPAKCLADDLLRALDDGTYAKSTAGIDWDKVQHAVKGRRSADTKKPKKPAKKAGTASSKSLIGVRTKSGLVFGYAAHLAHIRPGVDLTKPTYALAK